MKISLETICDAVIKWSLRATFFLTPIFFLPLTPYPVDINKQFIFISLVLIATIAWLVKSTKRGRVEYAKNYAGVPLAALVVFVILSALFSGARALSLVGQTGGETDTALAVIGFTLFYFLISVSFREKGEIKNAFIALMASGFVAVLHAALQVFGVSLLPWDFARSGNFNAVGTMNALSLYAGFIGVLSFAVAYYMPVTKRMRIGTGILASASFILAALIGYWAFFVAVIIALSLLVFFSRRSEDKKASRRNFLPLGIITVATCMLVLATGIIAIPVPRIAAPREVSPSISASIKIAADTARAGVKNFLLGSGPATYPYEYVAHRDMVLNGTLFWNVQFTQGFNAILTVLVSWGIFGTIILLLFLGIIVHTMVRLAANRRMDHVTGAAVALSAYSIITLFLYPQNFVLYFLVFASAGIVAALAAEGKGGYGAVSFSLPIGMMFAAVLAGGLLYVNGKRYVAGVQFGRGVAVAAETKDISKALPLLVSGGAFDPQNDAYLGVLASAYLAHANVIAGANAKAPNADAQKNVTDAIAKAVAAAERATQVNPLSAANWMALAQIYEEVAPLNAAAADSVYAVYSKAQSLDPFNPVIPTYVGNAHRATGSRMKSGNALEYAAAEKSYEAALALKPDYLQALFALGTLEYQIDNFTKARDALEQTVRLSPDYANALFFLGLTYEKLGSRANALATFERIAQLNPENAEIKGIIANVRAGKPALSSGETVGTTPKKK